MSDSSPPAHLTPARLTRPSARSIHSSYVLGQHTSGLVYADLSRGGYCWRLEQRIGGDLIAESIAGTTSPIDSLMALKRAAAAYELEQSIEHDRDINAAAAAENL